ncbi:uncharacterized protein SPSK_07005 [Sporothrix schenckii 1099-18]|uniref:Mucoidy inhibitor-like protein n=1 Tax=Sporothrix schenckii 1099-18 TaxID=1397361 RepID=A0A0F2MF23_SPOSC|nr:uncharacterized protein SPSK_07005 [Sporothrix schenckii 1099-18]KJR88298.1 hypothetical protein SPSK_07005 [Sporothrix schenckii 1099-18]
MDIIHKQEFRVRDLPTRTVTLFPSRAQVVRDIKDVSLKPGANQITVVGLSPTVDENSIKVEGTGSAIISDIAIELLPNREIFQDIYPESDDDDKSDTEEEEDSSDEEEAAELKEVRKKLQALRDEVKRANEVVASAESRLKFLDAYGKMLDRKRNVEIDAGVETYRAERAKVFDDHMAGTIRVRELNEQIWELGKDEGKLLRIQAKAVNKARRAREKAKAAKRKEKLKVQRRKAEAHREKLRVQREREKYWPRKCYTVRITLDAPSYTPSSSRRTSITSVTELAAAPKDKDLGAGVAVEEGADKGADSGGAVTTSGPTCDLSISYVTSSAFWSPTYDLQLSTTNNTATLCFDAQLTNTTAEAWTGCKVILSTSQTTFSGLNDTIPTLLPWRVKLRRGYGYDAVLHSREEVSHKRDWKEQQNALVTKQKPRGELFGVSSSAGTTHYDAYAGPKAGGGRPGWTESYNYAMPQQQMMQQQAPVAKATGGALFGSAAPVASSFGATTSNTGAIFGGAPRAALPPPAPAARMKKPTLGFGASNDARRYNDRENEFQEDEEDGGSSDGAGEGAAAYMEEMTLGGELQPELEFQESSFEETGMTTTYDLPGLKTLAPGSTASKQRVARIAFREVVFSHTIVAKYKPVAYLKAKLKNGSKLTLLKGTAGLTLDGSFLGRTTLPRCSAGDTFPLSLGVDPAIRVAYPKPDVKRATTGLFSKEDSSVYRRSVTISNTRASAGKPVTLLVLDQVPVSEDEKLRVELQQPRGVSVGGGSVPAGVGMVTATGTGTETATGTAAKDWGTASATLKKAGEIVWDVKLNAGRSVKLDLAYDGDAPSHREGGEGGDVTDGENDNDDLEEETQANRGGHGTLSTNTTDKTNTGSFSNTNKGADRQSTNANSNRGSLRGLASLFMGISSKK